METSIQLVRKPSMNAREIFMRYGALIALALLMLINILITRNFLSMNTLWLVIRQATPALYVAIGMTFVISAGGIDISVGSMMAFSAYIVASGITEGGNFWLFCLLSRIGCAAIGVFNGLLISKARIQPVILTLVMQIVMRGVTVMLAKSTVFPLDRKSLYPEVNLLGLYRLPGRVPIQTIFFVVIILIGLFVAHRTILGKRIEAVGGNEKAARLAGINTSRITTIAYVISAVLAAVGGILLMCRNAALDPNELGRYYETDAIAAVAVGGTYMKGGKVNLFGTVMGCVLLILVGTTVNMNGLPYALANIIKAVIIIVSLAIQREQSV